MICWGKDRRIAKYIVQLFTAEVKSMLSNLDRRIAKYIIQILNAEVQQMLSNFAI